MKKVSVIIPAFNKASLTEKTINSILQQTYKEIEIILVDDGSTDNTSKLKNKFKSHINYIYKKNQGASSARNVGISLAKGEYIALVDCDDIYEKSKIEESVKILEEKPEFKFIYTDVYLINDNDERILNTFNSINHPGSGYIGKKLLLSDFTITNSTLVAKKECFDIIGNFDENIFFAADRDILIRLGLNFKSFYIPKKLTGYRVGSGNIFNNLEKNFAEFIYILDKNFKSVLNISSQFKNKCYSNVYYNFAKYYASQNNMKESKRLFIQSLKFSFFHFKTIKIIIGIIIIYFNPNKLYSYLKNINKY